MPRSRKKRRPYTRYQTMVLENEFISTAYITRQKRWEISCKLQLTERQSTDEVSFELTEPTWFSPLKSNFRTVEWLRLDRSNGNYAKE
ncbi:unnamed protein product [Protopolystoma xenopodis]|uniref:Homeobox domain-containing protein n=1 Tax=Protopolystoma xenopodis TaxID=117903 RepID=A0A3S5AAP1_9PLAT|nr:unnamed protein product [Protopolystoma xenopodis]